MTKKNKFYLDSTFPFQTAPQKKTPCFGGISCGFSLGSWQGFENCGYHTGW
jgi:hypothetical protein